MTPGGMPTTLKGSSFFYNDENVVERIFQTRTASTDTGSDEQQYQSYTMTVKIIIPSSADEWDQCRSLHYEYIDYIGAHPTLRPYFLAQDFAADVAKMPSGYEPPDGICLLAYRNGIPCGTVAVRRFDRESCEMKRLYVKQELRGGGAGRMLIERAIDEAKKLGYMRMKLDNSKSVMQKANTLYRALGFYEIAPYNKNFVSDAYFMEKLLV